VKGTDGLGVRGERVTIEGACDDDAGDRDADEPRDAPRPGPISNSTPEGVECRARVRARAREGRAPSEGLDGLA
jgi:hypothetical protein